MFVLYRSSRAALADGSHRPSQEGGHFTLPTMIIRQPSSDTRAQNESSVMSALIRGRVYLLSLCVSEMKNPLTAVIYCHLQTKMFPGSEFI